MLERDAGVSIHLFVTREAKPPDESEGKVVQVATRFYVRYGRPNVDELVRTHIDAAKAKARQRVLVACCGPDTLTDDVRATTVDCMRDGPSVELHCEQFGW